MPRIDPRSPGPDTGQHPLEVHLAASWPPDQWSDVTVLLAVSGGPDSMALLHAISAIRPGGSGRLVVAHLNHDLRGRDADRDEALVRAAAERLGWELHVCRADRSALTARGQGGLEAAARRARYRFLLGTAERVGARYVATAHTADDQAETILHRIVRGTGLAGLAGMPRARPLSDAVTLIRPLLGIRRRQVVDYVQSRGVAFRVDTSNRDLTRTRNAIRQRILPQLEQAVHPQATDALLRLGQLASEAENVLQHVATRLSERSVVERHGTSVVVDSGPLVDMPSYLIRQLLIGLWRDLGWPRQAMGFVQWDRLARALAAPNPTDRSLRLPGGIEAVCHGRRWVVRRVG